MTKLVYKLLKQVFIKTFSATIRDWADLENKGKLHDTSTVAAAGGEKVDLRTKQCQKFRQIALSVVKLCLAKGIS